MVLNECAAADACCWRVAWLRWRGCGAQDTRTVTEPKIPAACVKLGREACGGGRCAEGGGRGEAGYGADPGGDGWLRRSASRELAVELAPGAEGANAFLSGPLELKEGVTLLVDKGVTLFASRARGGLRRDGAGDLRDDCRRRGRARLSSPSARRMSGSWAMA